MKKFKNIAVTLMIIFVAMSASGCGYEHFDYVSPRVLSVSGSLTSGSSETYEVTRVVDGDTVVVDISGNEASIRLIGVDTPESVNSDDSKNCSYGKVASKYTSSLLNGKKVTLEYDTDKTDVYGRTLAYVYLDGEMVNYNLVINGYAVAKEYEPNTRYADELEEAQIEAEKNKAGMWADDVTKAECNLKVDYYIDY